MFAIAVHKNTTSLQCTPLLVQFTLSYGHNRHYYHSFSAVPLRTTQPHHRHLSLSLPLPLLLPLSLPLPLPLPIHHHQPFFTISRSYHYKRNYPTSVEQELLTLIEKHKERGHISPKLITQLLSRSDITTRQVGDLLNYAYKYALADVFAFNSAIGAYCRLNQFAEAADVLTFMEHGKTEYKPNVRTYNIIINALGRDNNPEDAIVIYKRMRDHGVAPDLVTINSLLNIFGKLGMWSHVHAIYLAMSDLVISPDATTFTILIDACGVSNNIAFVEQIWEKMCSLGIQEPHAIACVITTYGKYDLVKAEEFFYSLKSRHIKVAISAINAMLNVYQRHWEAEKAEKLCDNIAVDYNVLPDSITYQYMVQIYSKNIKNLSKMKKIVMDLIEREDIELDLKIVCAIVGALSKWGALEEAEQMMQNTEKKGVPPSTQMFSDIIEAHCTAGSVSKAIRVFDQMKEKRLTPDANLIGKLIASLCDSKELQQAMDLVDLMKREGLRPHSNTVSCLLKTFEDVSDPRADSIIKWAKRQDAVW